MRIKQVDFFAGLKVNSGSGGSSQAQAQVSEHEWYPDEKINARLKHIPAKDVVDIRIIYEGFDKVNKGDWYSAYIIYEQEFAEDISKGKKFDELIDKLLELKPDTNKKMLMQAIRQKKETIGAGYLTDHGALFLVAADFGISPESLV
jgi:hypothetical protein